MPTNGSKPRSPKLPSGRATRAVGWYNYYAGFSADFVRDVITDLDLTPEGIVADPWNGSGTTTAVAQELGIRSWGGDINPAMVVVAKARLLGWHARPSEVPLCDGIVDIAERSMKDHLSEGDPLGAWFRSESAGSLRAIERAITHLLAPATARSRPTFETINDLSPLAAFFYLALFRTVQHLVRRFRCSNPTWITRPLVAREKLSPSSETVLRCFRASVRRMAKPDLSLVDRGRFSRAPREAEEAGRLRSLNISAIQSAATVAVADSMALPLSDDSVGALVSSPPYCTRIDYAITTSPELAVLGLTDTKLRELRGSMIGSSTVRRDSPLVDERWGGTCSSFLKEVASHPSKASATYYHRNHLQYFDGLFRSLTEADRVLRPGASCVLVLQDSYYKEVHNDLAAVVIDMSQALGWRLVDRHDYPSARHMGRVHPGTKAYRQTVKATESVLVLKTGD